MNGILNLTASSIRAMMCYIAPNGKPIIAYDNDKMAKPLYNKLKYFVEDRQGSQSCFISFNEDTATEKELYRQFKGVAYEIKQTFDSMIFEDDLKLINKKD